MSLSEALLGRTVAQAQTVLEKEGLAFEVVCSSSPRPDEHADEHRVVRVRTLATGVVELVVCAFRTHIVNA